LPDDCEEGDGFFDMVRLFALGCLRKRESRIEQNDMSGARILLKNTETNRYLGRGGTWTDKPEAAMAFLDEIRAKDHSVYHRLSNTVRRIASGGFGSTSPALTP